MTFQVSLFIKKPYINFLLIFIMFKQVKVGKHIEYMPQTLSRSMLIVKFHPGMKCLQVFLSFFRPGMKFHPCLKHKETLHHRQG